jgi:hypothetical protein
VERFQEKLQTFPVRKRDQIKDLEHFCRNGKKAPDRASHKHGKNSNGNGG